MCISRSSFMIFNYSLFIIVNFVYSLIYSTMINYKGVSIESENELLLHDVDVHIAEGEFVYLVGKVGSGKSSFLKSIYAEKPIVQGTARVFDEDLRNIRRSQIPFLRRKLGIIFQDFQLLVDRTVQQNLEFVLKATGWTNKEEMNRRIEEVLELVGMENKGYRMPNTLSGGEQQRIVIARALLNNPSVILADEPTGNLDTELGCNIIKILYEICQKQHAAVICCTHTMQYLELFPGRVLHVENNTIWEETPETSKTEEREKNVECEETEAETVVVEEVEPEEMYSAVSEESIDSDVSEEDVSAETIPQFESMLEVPEETQSDSTPDSDERNSAEDHCSPTDTQPVERSRNGQFDQIPSASAAL